MRYKNRIFMILAHNQRKILKKKNRENVQVKSIDENIG